MNRVSRRRRCELGRCDEAGGTILYRIVGRVLCGGRLECVDMIAMALGGVLVLAGAGLHGAG